MGEDALSYDKFWVAFAAWLGVLAIVGGVAQTLEVACGLRKFGGLEYASRVVALSAIRELSSGAVFSSALFAWITWMHGVEPEVVRSRFRAVALRVMLSAPFALPIAAWLAMLASFFLLASAFAIPWQTSFSGYRTAITVSDWAAGMVTTVCGLAALVVLSWVLMPRLSMLPWGLPRKCVTLWLGLGTVRLCFAIIEALVGAA